MQECFFFSILLFTLVFYLFIYFIYCIIYHHGAHRSAFRSSFRYLMTDTVSCALEEALAAFESGMTDEKKQKIKKTK